MRNENPDVFFNAIPVFGKLYDNANVWFNFGLIDKAPIFDQVIQDWDAKMGSMSR